MNNYDELVIPKDVIIVSETDEKGNIIFANDDFCKIAGYDINELIGNPHNIVRHPDMPQAAFKELWETIQSGRTWKGIVKNKTKSGGFYWVRATVYPSKDPSGNLRYISVRIKPTKQEISDAINLYSKL
jgi:aerotaxis receptor